MTIALNPETALEAARAKVICANTRDAGKVVERPDISAAVLDARPESSDHTPNGARSLCDTCFNQTRPLMLEVYDRERTAALLNKAREVTAGLKSEMGEIASQMSRVLDGREEDADGIDALGSDPQEQGRPQLTIPATTSQQRPTRKSFWQFWR